MKPELQKIVDNINAKTSPLTNGTKIIAVDGHGGSGKSTLADKLAELLDAEILHIDDFGSLNKPTTWWTKVIDKALEPIKTGAKSLSYERGKWAEDHNPEPVVDQPVSSIIILEGVTSSRKEFRPYLTYSIWVDTPREICLQRGLERDGEHMRQQWNKWLKAEDEYIARDKPQDYADIIVSGIK